MNESNIMLYVAKIYIHVMKQKMGTPTARKMKQKSDLGADVGVSKEVPRAGSVTYVAAEGELTLPADEWP